MDRPRFSMPAAWNVLCPMLQARRGILPTPLLPGSASAPRSGRVKPMSPSTTVGP